MASRPSTGQAGEAVDPQLDFAAFVDSMTEVLEASTSAAARLPDKSDMGFHRTLDRKYAKGIDATSARVLKITNALLDLAVESSGYDAKNDGKKVKQSRNEGIEDEDVIVDHFRSSVIDIVDSLLENADSNLDEANGEKRKAAIDVKASIVAQAGKKLPGPSGISKFSLPSHLANDQRIPKPQLAFRDKVNNASDQPPWKPTLPVKHHGMVPLEWQPSEEDMPTYVDPVLPEKRQRDIRMRYHPYFYETKHLPYPTSLFVATPPITPKSFEDTPFEFVNTPEQLAAMTETLKKAKEIAVDLEANNTRSYYGITCLMQISTREGDWVVDTLALRSELRDDKLGGVLADPAIVKVFHGADSDIVWLQRDFDLYVVNLFDTYHACKVLEFPQFSLASLLKLYCDFDADKRYQMADWRIRPIPDEMLFYARSDTHFLLYVYDSLRNALIARASRTPSPSVEVEGGEGASTPKPNPQRAIREVLEKSAETALKLCTQDPYDHEKGIGQNGWNGLIKKLAKKEIETEVGFVFKRLHFWRDSIARDLDESPHYVLPNHTLVMLSRLRPQNAVVIGRKLAAGAPLVESRVNELAEVIRKASQDYETSPGGKIVSAAQPATQKANTNDPVVKRTNAADIRPDMWADLIATKPVKKVSTLFGEAKGKKASSAVPSPASSSLFGRTLVKPTSSGAKTGSRAGSPGFAAIQTTIHAGLQPQRVSAQGVTNPAPPKAETVVAVAEPETVEFVPAAKRKNAGSTPATMTITTSPDAPSSPGGTAPSSRTTPLVNEEGIVAVKKNRKAKRAALQQARELSVAAAGSGEASSASTPASSAAAATPTSSTKPKKAKVKPEQIPEFDYSAVPDLLDNPDAATRKVKKPKKKDQKKKKPADGIDTSAFRKPPSDPTQPKSGNRSGTFAR